MAIPFLLSLAISVALNVVAYLLMPKPKQPKPEAAREMDAPTAEAGKEIPVIFGTVLLTAPNCLDFTEKSVREYEIKA